MIVRSLRIALAAFALAAAASTAALAQTPMGPAMTATTTLGTVLVGPNGRTLYTWDRDTAPNVSTCYNQCAVNWPPFLVEAGATATGDWTIVPRTDGTSVWAYQGKPLYYFINDAAAGDVNGNQPTGTWHAVLVAAAAPAMGPAMTAVTPLGTILVGPNGRTLYTWDRDTAPNVSTCYNQCAVNWPPFTVEAGATATGDWTIVPRTDGTSVWAYQGKPLYYFINDANPGDLNGNQPTGTWHAVVIAGP